MLSKAKQLESDIKSIKVTEDNQEEMIEDSHKNTHATHPLSFDQTSELDEEEVKEEVKVEKEAKAPEPKEPASEPKEPEPVKKPKIIPDPKFLADLMNMGFSKEESEAALIAVKNGSVDLALDKVFELKKQAEDQQEASLQNVIQKSLDNLSKSGQNNKEKQTEEEKKKEEEDKKEMERQLKLENDQKLKQEKEQQLEGLHRDIDRLRQAMEEVRKRDITGFSMVTSFEPTVSPIVASCVFSKDGKHYLNVKTVSYYHEYLNKVIKRNENTETCLLDSYEVVSLEAPQDTPSNEALQHALSHSKFSINTLIPLFVGYQLKRNWTLEKNRESSLIFKESEERMIDLGMFTEIYGCVTIKDHYTSEYNSLIAVYGRNDKPILVPIEISPNIVTVSNLPSIS